MELKVLYKDDSLLVLDKPPGLVVDKSETQQEDTLESILQKEFGMKLERSGIVHRLDKDTSGVLLVAKTQAALENLQAQFKNRKTKKEYLALVHGEVGESGVIRGNIGRNPVKREKFTVLDEEGKEAVTEYEPLDRLQFMSGARAGALGDRLQEVFHDFNEQSSRAGFHPLTKIQMRKLERMSYNQFTLLACKPLTGRTHQIRVHLKYIGHPIVADEKYGGRKMIRLDKRWCPRMFLHAKRLGFYHPTSGRWMHVQSPLPDDLESVLNKLENQE